MRGFKTGRGPESQAARWHRLHRPGTQVWLCRFQQSQAHRCSCTCTGFSTLPAEACGRRGSTSPSHTQGLPRCTPGSHGHSSPFPPHTPPPALHTFSTRFPGGSEGRLGRQWLRVSTCVTGRATVLSCSRRCGRRVCPCSRCDEGAELCPRSSLWTRAPCQGRVPTSWLNSGLGICTVCRRPSIAALVPQQPGK